MEGCVSVTHTLSPTLFQRWTAIPFQLLCAMVLAMPGGEATARPFNEDAVKDLSGSVKTIVITPGNGLVNTYRFDHDGHVIEASFRLAEPNQDPSWPRTMKFDYNGGLKRSALLSHPDGLALRTAYGYNDRAQYTAEVTIYNDGTFYEAVLRQYSETGHLTDELVFTDRRGLFEMRHYEDDTLVREWLLDAVGPQVIKGRRDEETGRWSEVRYHDSSNGSKDDHFDAHAWSIYLYDSHHNPTAILGFSRKGTFTDLTHNHYEYDKMGNWLVRETLYSFPTVGGSRRNRATREITYFEGGTDKSTP